MELKFDELENPVNSPPSTIHDMNYINYWSNANPSISESSNQKKPKISYDDILSSLNMVVNNGVLQFAKASQQSHIKSEQVPTQQKKQQVIIKTPSNIQPEYQENNYITNKYFKDYKKQTIIEEPQIPMTKEEYKQMLIKDYINRQQAQRRISQIKSRKLLFNTQNINISPIQMPRDMNKLFKPFSR